MITAIFIIFGLGVIFGMLFWAIGTDYSKKRGY